MKLLLEYLNKSRSFSAIHHTNWEMEAEIGELFRLMGQYDSSFYYLKKITSRYPRELTYKVELAETYLAIKEYDKAFNLYKEVIDSCRAMKSNTDFKHKLGESLIGVASIQLEKNDIKLALKNIREGIGFG